MKHLIGKQIMDFKMLHAGDVFDVSNQLSALYWQQIVPLLENLFDQYSDREEIIRIDRLQIDLGHLTADQLRQGQFLDILKRLLEQELSRLVQENNAKAEKLPIAYGQFEQWLFFLEKGYFPWNSYQPEEDWQGSILENLATNTFAVDQLRQLVIRNQVVTERMVLQYAPSFLKTIVELYTGRKQNDLVEAAKELRVLARQEPSLKPSRQLIKWSTHTLELFYWQKIIEEAIKRKSTREPRELIGQFFQRYYTSQTLNVLYQALEGKQFPTLVEALAPFVKAQEQNSPSPEREKPRLRPFEFPDTEVGKGTPEGFDTELKNKPSNLERKEEALDNESEPKREKTPSKREDKPQVMDQEGAESREASLENQPKRTIESVPEDGEGKSPEEQFETPNENLKSKESLGNEPWKSEADEKRKLEKDPSKSEQKPDTGQEQERKEALINKQKDLEIFPEEEIDSVTEEPRKQPTQSSKGADPGEANEGEATSEGNSTPLEESILDLGKTPHVGKKLVEPSKDATEFEREEQEFRPGEKQENFDDRTFEHPEGDSLAKDELGGSPKRMAFTREDVFPELEAEEEIPSYLQQDKAPPYYQISSNEEIYLANAGIILVHPFLVRYFENIGLLDRRIFKNEKARHRAIKLLHYLVTGESRIPEHQMVLPKVLCGLPIDVPIDHRLRLTKKQKSEGDAMLEAVIEHWGVLGKTSIAGLREGFLRRDGKLSFSNGAWNLKVEQQTLDILLDKLPWGIGIIKLPWMLDMLKVEWRQLFQTKINDHIMPDNSQNLERNPLQEIISEINCLSLGLLWTGLTILSKDMMEFLSVGAYDNFAVTRFRQIYIKALNEDRAYWEVYGPELYRPLKDISGMPSGFAHRARKGNFDLTALTQEIEDVPTDQETIIRKWTHYPGWELSKQAGMGLSSAICHADQSEEETVGLKIGSGTYDCDEGSAGATSPLASSDQASNQNTDEQRPPSEQEILTLKLARKILYYGLKDEPYWYPLVAYIAHLLVRTGYSHFCEMPVMSSSPTNGNVVSTTG